jgi:1-acyl-sn-glycerol-3-phosphate acyltransferase
MLSSFSVFAKKLLNIIFRALFLDIKIRGIENVPLDEPLIVVSNHQSNADPPIIVYVMPRDVAFLAKKSLFNIPPLRLLMNHMKFVSVNRQAIDRQAIKKSAERVKEGYAVCIFPEGTRSTDGKIKKFKPGIGYIWYEAGFPKILPMAIKGSIDIMKKGEMIPNASDIKVNIGKPVEIDRCIWNEEKRKESAVLVAEILEKKVKELFDEL